MAYVTFANQSGAVPSSQLDSNFAQAAYAADLTTLDNEVAALPSNATPLIPVVSGTAGVATTLSRSDHQHPPQSATVNLQTGTTYTLAASDNGKVVEFSNVAGITVTIPNSLVEGFNCLMAQVNTGQVTFVAGASATQRQASSYTKTRARWSEVTMRVRANSGGAAAEYVLSGDMAA